jgi:hypothetical protein
MVKLYCHSSIKEDAHHLIPASSLSVCSKETTLFASPSAPGKYQKQQQYSWKQLILEINRLFDQGSSSSPG